MKKTIFLFFVFLFFLKTGYSQYVENYSGNFNGSNSYVATVNNSFFSPTSAITLEAWVYPTVLQGSTMAVIGKNYQTGYFLGIQTSGRVVFYPKGSSSFRSKVSSVIPINKWTHIAGTYDGTTTKIYINAVLDTSTTAYSGPIGTNSDSLFFGADRIGTVTGLFFRGRLDNIRIWGTARTLQEIINNRFIPLEVYDPSGIFSNLRACLQLDNSPNINGGPNILFGFGRNLSYVNYSNKAVNHLDYNNNLVLNGTTDYFSIKNNAGFNATTSITLEAWIRRDTTGSQSSTQNIVNKSGGSTRYDYGLIYFLGGQLGFTINSENFVLLTPLLVTNKQWTHIAASYNSANGEAIFYVNGDSVAGTTFSGNPTIENNPDSLYIGGIGASLFSPNKFKGQIDGVRIWKVERTQNQIRENMYKDAEKDPNLSYFNFDKYTNAFYSGGVRIYAGNNFAGSAHISSSHLNENNELTSPMISDSSGGFYSSNYTSSYKRFFVPDNNTTGIKDSIYISSGGTITNLKVYILMSHTWMSDMVLNLISPSGTTVTLFNQRGSVANDLMTIFSDAADSAASGDILLDGPGINAPFSPGIKPDQPLSLFNGENKLGWWKLKLVDNALFSYGYVHGWGVKITSTSLFKTLKLTSLIQGFYESTSDKMANDTALVYLRDVDPPYDILDTAKSVLDSTGKGNFIFTNAPFGLFFIVVKHRNSIETWSSANYIFTSDTVDHNFTLAASQAYGSNQIQVNLSPDKYAVYSGDVNQDAFVDLTDLTIVYNDANNFVTGYVNSDVTGNNITDLTDVIIVFNNSSNFVRVIKP